MAVEVAAARRPPMAIADVARVAGPTSTVVLQAFPDVALRLSDIFA